MQALKNKTFYKNKYFVILIIGIVFFSSYSFLFTASPAYSYDNYDEINNFASSTSNYVIQGMRGDLQLYSLQSRTALWGIQGPFQPNSKLALSHDGTFLAVGTGNAIFLYNTQFKSLQYSYINHSDGIDSLTFSYNDSLLISASHSGEIVTFNLNTLKITVSMFLYGIKDIKSFSNTSFVIIQTSTRIFIRPVANITSDNISNSSYLSSLNVGYLFDSNQQMIVTSNGANIDTFSLLVNSTSQNFHNTFFSKYSDNLITKVALDSTSDYVAAQLASGLVAIWTTKLDTEIITIPSNVLFSHLTFLSNGLLGGVAGNKLFFFNINQYIFANNARMWIFYPGAIVWICVVLSAVYFDKKSSKNPKPGK